MLYDVDVPVLIDVFDESETFVFEAVDEFEVLRSSFH